MKNWRKSDACNIVYLASDFLENAKFFSVFHICNYARLKCFFPKFLNIVFLSCKNLKKFIELVRNLYKWTGNIFDMLVSHCLLTDHKRILRALKLWVKTQVCKWRKNLCNFGFSTMDPVSDLFFVVNHHPKTRMTSHRCKE